MKTRTEYLLIRSAWPTRVGHMDETAMSCFYRETRPQKTLVVTYTRHLSWLSRDALSGRAASSRILLATYSACLAHDEHPSRLVTCRCRLPRNYSRKKGEAVKEEDGFERSASQTCKTTWTTCQAIPRICGAGGWQLRLSTLRADLTPTCRYNGQGTEYLTPVSSSVRPSVSSSDRTVLTTRRYCWR